MRKGHRESHDLTTARTVLQRFLQILKEMRGIQRRLNKGPLDVQEYGRQQLQGMLSMGPYSYLQVPTPQCAADITEDDASQVMIWKRTCVSDYEASAAQVCNVPT